MRWIKDQKVEGLLRKLGVKFEMETFPFTRLDLEEGLRQQARVVGKLNENSVMKLALAMAEQEAEIPMGVVNRPKSGRMIPYSANHRFAGFQLQFVNSLASENVTAYVVQVYDPPMMELLPRVLNVLESEMGYPKEERIAQCLYLATKHGWSLADVCSMFNVKPEWVNVAARAEEVRSVLLPDFGAEKLNGLSKSSLMKMHSLLSNKNVLKQFAKVAVDHHLGLPDVEHMSKDVKGHGTELSQLGEIDRWDKMLKARSQKPESSVAKVVRLHLRQRFLNLLVRMEKLLEKHRTLEKVQCTSAGDIQLIAKSWSTIERHMKQMLTGKGG